MTDILTLARRCGCRVAPWPLRLPIIRRIRCVIFTYRVNRHYDFWLSMGMLGGWTKDELNWREAILRGEA
jgi:hypothetical protein